MDPPAQSETDGDYRVDQMENLQSPVQGDFQFIWLGPISSNLAISPPRENIKGMTQKGLFRVYDVGPPREEEFELDKALANLLTSLRFIVVCSVPDPGILYVT